MQERSRGRRAALVVWRAERGWIGAPRRALALYARIAASISPMPKMRITRFRL